MKLKSYFAPTVEAAVEQARREMGPEAVIVESRKAPPEARALGAYEVVCALLAPGEESPAALLGELGRIENPRPGLPDLLSRELAQLRRQIQELRQALWRREPADLSSPLWELLIQADVDAGLARQILERANSALAGAAPAEARAGLAAQLESWLQAAPELGREGARPRVVALVGPPGAGKTTTLVKLGVRFGIQHQQRLHIISTESERVAGAEPLRTYAAILGAGFQILDTSGALAQVLEEHRNRDLILLDTRGFGPADRQEAAELASWLCRQPELDIHLVLPATGRTADLLFAVERFEVFRPSKLIFTRLDEAVSLGPLFSVAALTGKPVSFLGTGQSIPEDLEPASASRIVEAVLGGQARALAAA
ncbi:MAG TPA: hypothetical protein VNJ11_14250 [Bryobacteraceae bacterium]|nr:hypothetical protein [Bryobacteraceae bacterium]